MRIKEAFRYQNVLTSWIAAINDHLNNNRAILFNIRERHLRSSVIAGGKDEVLENPNRDEGLAKAGACIDTLMDLHVEKMALTQAIGKAKKSGKNGFNYDVAIEQNIERNKMIQQLLRLSKLRGSKHKSNEYDYTFNQDGNQVQYQYPVETEYSIDFDKNHVQSILRKIQKERDKVSDEIELFKLATEIEFEPKFDMNLTATELVTQMEEAKNA